VVLAEFSLGTVVKARLKQCRALLNHPAKYMTEIGLDGWVPRKQAEAISVAMRGKKNKASPELDHSACKKGRADRVQRLAGANVATPKGPSSSSHSSSEPEDDDVGGGSMLAKLL
jgi:hypothetical protein